MALIGLFDVATRADGARRSWERAKTATMKQASPQLCLAAVCIAIMHLCMTTLEVFGRFPVLASTLWFTVWFWSLALGIYAFRWRLVGCVSATVSLCCGGIGGGIAPRQPKTAKTTRSGSGHSFEFVSCEMQGWRDNMEDALVCESSLDLPVGAFGLSSPVALFAVFDGHGGADASALVAARLVEQIQEVAARRDEDSVENALRRVVLDLEGLLRKNNTPMTSNRPDIIPPLHAMGRGRFEFMGCTAAIALLATNRVVAIGVGDSRVFKCRDGVCVPLTRDHKPESPRERQRIEAAGGAVVRLGTCYRVDANLNLSRALGDFRYKDPKLNPEDQKISPVGDTFSAEIDELDEFLVVACDGLFELMTWDSVCAFVRQRLQRGVPLESIAEELLDECCSSDIFASQGRGTDNESVIIVKLNCR